MKKFYEGYAEFINGFPLWILVLAAVGIMFTVCEVGNYVGEAMRVVEAYNGFGDSLEMIGNILKSMVDLYN